MPICRHFGTATLLVIACAAGYAAAGQAAERPGRLPSDTPGTFTPKVDAFDYVKREVMIPMRDGVKLKTFVLVPKGADRAPILLNRTPYDASDAVLRFNSPHLAAVVPQMFDTAVAGGYIVVVQDVRGCHTTGHYKAYTCYGCHEHEPTNVIKEHEEVSFVTIEFENCAECHPDGIKIEGDNESGDA